MAEKDRYDEIMSEIVSLIVSHFPKTSTESVADGDLDSVIDEIYNNSSVSQGCILEYVNSTRLREDKAFVSWDHLYGGVFLVRLEDLDTIEEEKREVISLLWTLSNSIKAQRLNNSVHKAYVETVERAREGDINEHPFYLIPFSLIVRDRRP